MIDLEFLERLIHALDESGIDHVEIERGGTRVRISKSPFPAVPPQANSGPGSAAAAVQAAPGRSSPSDASAGLPDAVEASGASSPTSAPGIETSLAEITSPMVGTFYRAAAPDQPPFTDVGKRIATGDTLCIIEAMKLMNELEAEIEGVVQEVCVANGEPVEYGQVLFRVEPA